MSEIPASEALIEFVFACLDQGTSMVEDGSTLIPYVVSETPVGLELTRLVSDTLEGGREQAKAHAATSDALRVGVVYDGYLTVEGERSDAIFVEAQECRAPPSVVFAQRYRPQPSRREAADDWRAFRRLEALVTSLLDRMLRGQSGRRPSA